MASCCGGVLQCGSAERMLPMLKCMSYREQKCDLVICAEGKTIHVHKEVLCAASDYFKAMFSNDTKEKQDGFIDMKGIQIIVLEKCIDFIYSGKFVESEEGIMELLNAANLMLLDDLLDNISEQIARSLTLHTFFDIKEIADVFALKTLSGFCDEFALENFFLLAQEEKFNSLHPKYISFLLSSKKSFVIKAENSKLSIALEWIKTDPDNREKYFLMLTQAIDFSKLSPEYAIYLVQNEPLCSKHPEVLKKICIGMATSYDEDRISPPHFHLLKQFL